MPGDLSVTPFWISPSLLTLSSVSSIPAEEAASTVDSELRYWCSELSCCVHKGCSGKGHFSKINISDLNFKWTVLPTFLWPCTLQGVQRTYQVSRLGTVCVSGMKKDLTEQVTCCPEFQCHSNEVLPVITDLMLIMLHFSGSERPRVQFKTHLVSLSRVWMYGTRASP